MKKPIDPINFYVTRNCTWSVGFEICMIKSVQSYTENCKQKQKCNIIDQEKPPSGFGFGENNRRRKK